MTRNQEQDSVVIPSPTIVADEHMSPHSSVRDLFVRKGRRKIGVIESLRAIVTSSCKPNSLGFELSLLTTCDRAQYSRDPYSVCLGILL